MPAHSRFSSYEEAVAAHRWDVPERYNIAAGRLRQAPSRAARDALGAHDGATSASSPGGAAGRSPTRPRTSSATHGVGKGDRVAVVLPPTPETAAIFFGTWKLGAILLSMSVLYGDDGDSAPSRRLRAEDPRHDAANAGRFDTRSPSTRS